MLAHRTYYPYELELEGQSGISKKQKHMILVNYEMFVVEDAAEKKTP